MKHSWFGIFLSLLLLNPAALWAQPLNDTSSPRAGLALAPGFLTVLPQDGRALYFQAFDSAKREILVEICVLEDPAILRHVEAALRRGVQVRAIVDRGKYQALPSEQTNLARYLVHAGGQLHLSNPIFPRSFPKIILVDSSLLVYGSACLDTTTFMQYRDFATTSRDPQIVRDLLNLFANDWSYSAAVGKKAPAFNPTPPVTRPDLLISPVTSAARLVRLYQAAERTLDVYTELLGNPTLESELAAAVKRGVRVRLIAPETVNGGTPDDQMLQRQSLSALAKAGVDVHVSGPDQTPQLPYMHARAAIVDGRIAFLGSISLSPNSITFNREMGLIFRNPLLVASLEAQFRSDYRLRTSKF